MAPNSACTASCSLLRTSRQPLLLALEERVEEHQVSDSDAELQGYGLEGGAGERRGGGG